MSFLITRPEHDDATFFLSEYSKELIKFAKRKGFDVINCQGNKVTKQNVTQIM